MPLSVARRSLAAGTPTHLAITQVRAVQAARAATAPTAERPILLLDSSYDIGQLGEAELGVDLLARVATNRCFYRRPIPKRLGRPALHGERFKVNDATTHGEPDHTTLLPDALHGSLRIDRWDRLHRIEVARIELSLIRIQFDHYAPQAHRAGSPPPLWLVWIGPELPDLTVFLTWYTRRFAIEHACRFRKQTLGWTTPRVRHPEAADRWSWLLAIGLWQLWLARQAATARPLPWERRVPQATPPPGQVRRAFARRLLTVGTPARPPQPRGKSPGRQHGTGPGRRRRYPARNRPPQPRKTRRNTLP